MCTVSEIVKFQIHSRLTDCYFSLYSATVESMFPKKTKSSTVIAIGHNLSLFSTIKFQMFVLHCSFALCMYKQKT